MFILNRWLLLYKQKTAYEMRISDWSSDVCASDLEAKDRLVSVMRKVQPAFMLTHSKADPYNSDHPYATQVTLECRSTAQAWGHNPGEKALGAPQLYLFEPHQTEQCEWRPDTILDITDRKSTRLNSSH